MLRNLTYLRYVLVHKWHVFKAGLALGVPLKRLILHDMSKFSKHEWPQYRDFFHIKDEATFELRQAAFQLALAHHYRHNDHHPQHWNGEAMPAECILEMVANWIGAARAQGVKLPRTLEWYEKNYERMNLHPYTEEYMKIVVADAYIKGMVAL